ncbi:recombinase family protein [Chloroflexota bacterium]
MGNDAVRIATYSRVSTQEQAEEGTSLESQEEQVKTYCKAHVWEVFRVYTDSGYSGKDDNRPGLRRLLSDAKFGLFTKVIVYKLDRLSRNLRLLLELEEKLKEFHVNILSIKETIDTSTPIGRTVFQVLGLVSEWEREAIIERTRSGRIQRYREGSWAGGKPPYGYVHNKLTRKLELYDLEANIVRRIFNQYKSGKSLNGIANLLNEDGVEPRSAKGKGWRATAIRNILINPVYKGTLIVNRHQHIANIARVDMSKAITISVPDIIPEKDWQSAQHRLTDNKHVRPQRENKWLLQGLVFCGLCGLSFKAEASGKNRYYNCRGRHKYRHLDGSPLCTVPRLRADWLEGEVWRKIEDIINDPNALLPLLEDAIKGLRRREEELTVRIQPIDDRLSQITEQKSRLADEWVKLNLDALKYRKMQQSLGQEESRLRSIRSEVDPAQLEELKQTRDLLSFWEGQCKYLDYNLEDNDGRMVRIAETPHKTVLGLLELDDKGVSTAFQFPGTRRELLDRLQVKVIVFTDRVEVKALFPIAPICSQKCTSSS